MCRARVCCTGAPSAAPRRSTSLITWKPPGLRSTGADLARLHALHRLGKQLRHPVFGAPAHRAALQRVGRIRIARRDLREIGAGHGLGARLVDLLARRFDLLRARLLGQAHQHVRQVVLVARAAVAPGFGEELVDLGVGHLDAVVDFALAQPLHLDLLAHLLAEALEGDAVLLQHLAEPGQRHVVVLGDALQRLVELELLDADAGIARQLQLRLVDDQPVEDLALEQRALGQRRALAPQLAFGETPAARQAPIA